MDTRDELLGQARKDGKLNEASQGRELEGQSEQHTESNPKNAESRAQRSDDPAIPYGNPGTPVEPPESPEISSFA